jgi:hypothetical protein
VTPLQTGMGLISIREGATRRVLVVGPFAIKFAIGARGRRCNRYEAECLSRASVRRRAMLCPVLWCTPSGNVLVMRAARPLTESEKAIVMRICGFPDWDYVPPDETAPFEYKASDWGWLDGRLVSLDYSAPALF